jgi:hypothetical protein
LATLKQAEAARAQFADELARRGAHGVGVEETKNDGWRVVALVEPGKKFGGPTTLDVVLRGSTIPVKLKVAREALFKAE